MSIAKRDMGRMRQSKDDGDRVIGRGMTSKGAITNAVALRMHKARAAGDDATADRLQDRLIRRMDPVVKAMIAGFRYPVGYYWDRDDMRNVGRMAIVRAARLFDPERGSFTTIATYAIRTDLRNMYHATSPGPVFVPAYIRDAMHSMTLGRDPYQPVREDCLAAAKSALGQAYALGSDDMPLDLPDLRAEDPTEVAEAGDDPLRDERARFRKALGRLPARDREIVRKVYGLGCPQVQMKDIAVERGVTREAIRLRLNKAMHRIHEMLGLAPVGSTAINLRIHAA